MFTCAKIMGGDTYLDKHLSSNDYYHENEHVAGVWLGKGAEKMSLTGKAIERGDAAFEALRCNMMPDGSGSLTPKKREEKSVRFFDFQCAPHKSVSVMAVVMEDDRLRAAHVKASSMAFAELERFAAFRSGRTREAELSGNVCAAAFFHDASRSLDPQLHTHFVVANATFSEKSGQWLALDTCEMFRAIRYAGKFYQNELALECRRLGYDIETVRNEKCGIEGFQIKGVTDEIQKRFSKRRSEVEAGIARFEQEKGRPPTVAEIHVITRETRNVKMNEITTPEVRALQRGQLSPKESDSLEEIKRAAKAKEQGSVALSMRSAWKALERAQRHLFERNSVLHGHKVCAEALNQHLGFIDTNQLRKYMTSAYNGFVRLVENAKNPLLSCKWSTHKGLELERWAVKFVNQTQDNHNALGKTEGVTFDFKSEEQKRVVLETLENRDQVYAIRGCAGAGKTTSLKEISKGLKAAGRKAFYLAPTSSAVKVLQRDGFDLATTVDSFLVNQTEIQGLRNSVLMIDESSLQSSKMGARILQTAQQHDARVLLIGDVQQHVSIEAGDFLRILEQHSNLRQSELTDIRRQQVQEYNDAIRAMSNGNAISGLTKLDEMGWVKEGKGQYIQNAAAAWMEATENGVDQNRCIAISPTWAENHRFTKAIRDGLQEKGLLGEARTMATYEGLDWTDEQRRRTDNYTPGMIVTFNSRVGNIMAGENRIVERIESGKIWLQGAERGIDVEKCSQKLSVSRNRDLELCPGDKILIQRNARKEDLINGQVLTVGKIFDDGAIETREGQRIPASFRHFCHGYVVTSHKSQGRTHDKVILAAEKLDSKATYVACSRGRREAMVFTPDKEFMMDELRHSSNREAALDAIKSSKVVHWDAQERKARLRAIKASHGLPQEQYKPYRTPQLEL